MEKVLFEDGIFEYVEIEKEYTIDENSKNIKMKLIRRPPGIRAIIVDKENKKILLSKEFRYELNAWDYRLPGGKVFDAIEPYREALKNNTLLENVEKTVKKEVLEEIGLIVKNQRLIKTSKAGSSIIWDLYYYEITDYEISGNGSSNQEDEVIDGYIWASYEEVKNLCLNGNIHEERSIGVLLTYILNEERV